MSHFQLSRAETSEEESEEPIDAPPAKHPDRVQKTERRNSNTEGGSYLGGGVDRCPKCDKVVYKVEEFPFQGRSWHKTCFNCGGLGELGCGRNVSNLDYSQQLGEPYCKACFARNFMEGGARGSSLGVDASATTTWNTTTSKVSSPTTAADGIAAAGGLGGGEKCPICVKTVYKMEAVAFQSQSWHKACFNCGGSGDLGCKRNLSNLDYSQQAGVPYCKACFARNFMEGGARGASTSLESSGESGRGRSMSSASAPSPSTDSTTPAFLGGGEKCPICAKTVYKMEAVAIQGQSWHKACFNCGGSGDLGCGRNVSNLDFSQQGGLPYCKACFARNFMDPSGAVLSRESTSGSAPGSAPGSVIFGSGDDNEGESGSRRSGKSSNLGGGDKCPICAKTVYKVEAFAFQNASWHKACFNCGGSGDLGCGRNVSTQDYSQQAGVPYCKACFARNFLDPTSSVVVSRESTSGSAPGSAPGSVIFGNSDDNEGESGNRRSGKSDVSEVLANLGGGNKCPICAKTVYKVEAFAFQNASWHKACFNCGGSGDLGCGRNLSSQDYSQQAGVPYCKACFARNFMEGGARGVVSNVGNDSSHRDQRERPAIAESSSVGSSFGGGDKCPICVKTVYKMEAVAFQSQSWHKACFNCGGSGDLGCKRNVSSQDYSQQAGVPYCKACFARNFMEGGARGVSGGTDPNRKSSPITATDTGSGVGASGPSGGLVTFGGGEKCPICVKTVYKMEAVAFQSQSWHKACFNCGGSGDLGCKRNVSNLDYKQHGGIPYCSACFTHSFMVGNSLAAVGDAGGSAGSAVGSAGGSSSKGGGGDAGGASTQSDSSDSSSSPSSSSAVVNLGGGDKCPICVKTVYKMEAIAVQGKTWHKTCFTCGGSGELGCRRNVSNLDYTFELGNPYCRACFQRNFTPLGVASSVAASASSSTILAVEEGLERASLGDKGRV